MAEPTTGKPRRAKPPAKKSTSAKSQARPSASSVKTAAKVQPGSTAAQVVVAKSPPTSKQHATQRKLAQAKQDQTTPTNQASAKPARDDRAGMAGEIRTLRAEKAKLTAELAALQARVVELEAARVDAINRIDWVIDSLQSLSGQSGAGQSGFGKSASGTKRRS